MILGFAVAAIADLEAIGDWIAQDNPVRAVSFIVELKFACEKLLIAPRANALVPRFERAQIRRRPYGSYLIFYRINGNVLEILHILHGARDYATILAKDFK